jgi:hypothetical protein
MMAQFQTPWEEGHLHLLVRRAHLLEDSFRQFSSLEEGHLHR